MNLQIMSRTLLKVYLWSKAIIKIFLECLGIPNTTYDFSVVKIERSAIIAKGFVFIDSAILIGCHKGKQATILVQVRMCYSIFVILTKN